MTISQVSVFNYRDAIHFLSQISPEPREWSKMMATISNHQSLMPSTILMAKLKWLSSSVQDEAVLLAPFAVIPPTWWHQATLNSNYRWRSVGPTLSVHAEKCSSQYTEVSSCISVWIKFWSSQTTLRFEKRKIFRNLTGISQRCLPGLNVYGIHTMACSASHSAAIDERCV